MGNLKAQSLCFPPHYVHQRDPGRCSLQDGEKALEAGGVKGLVEPTMYYWGQ